jgi:4-hydroxy-3-methylbut-2-en-1-yl diphosphate synthase IspG/GcpE
MKEAKMGALVFVCPTSGREVSTGVEIDAESYRDLPKVLAEISCPACGRTHNLYQVEARLVDGEQNSPRDS